MSLRPALFLDRDGVINIDHAYVYRPENFEFIDGIFDLCRMAKKLEYLLIVVTNQAGIGRGYYTEADFMKLTKWMREVFLREGAPIDGIYFCPFHPEHGLGVYKAESLCRKPAPGMILQAAEEHGIDLAKSMLIGDKLSDMQAGVAAGVGCNFFYCHEVTSLKAPPGTVVISRLVDVLPAMARNGA